MRFTLYEPPAKEPTGYIAARTLDYAIWQADRRQPDQATDLRLETEHGVTVSRRTNGKWEEP